MVNTVTVPCSLVCLQFRDGSVGDSPAANGQLCELSSRAEIVKKECLFYMSGARAGMAGPVGAWMGTSLGFLHVTQLRLPPSTEVSGKGPLLHGSEHSRDTYWKCIRSS